jgi:GNAT superfamily N-acetyltransferase
MKPARRTAAIEVSGYQIVAETRSNALASTATVHGVSSPSSDVALAIRLERAMAAEAVEQAETMALVWPDSGAATIGIADGVAVFTGPKMFANRAGGIGLESAVTARDLTKMERFYAGVGTAASLQITSYASDAFLGLLSKRGYVVEGFRSNYVRTVTRLSSRRDGIEVVRVTPDLDATWSAAVINGFGSPPGVTKRWNAMICAIENEHRFIAYVDGVPAGVGSLLITEPGLAQFGGTATVPAYRNRGVQAALLHARLTHARRLGCTLATVSAISGNGSCRNIERAGFRFTHTSAIMTKRSHPLV